MPCPSHKADILHAIRESQDPKLLYELAIEYYKNIKSINEYIVSYFLELHSIHDSYLKSLQHLNQKPQDFGNVESNVPDMIKELLSVEKSKLVKLQEFQLVLLEKTIDSFRTMTQLAESSVHLKNVSKSMF